MANVTFDATAKTMDVVFTDREMVVLNRVIATEGVRILTELIKTFLESHQMDQIEQDRISIKRFADSANEQQRATIIAMMPGRP